MSDLYGPGSGALFGLAWSGAVGEREFARERERLLQAARDKEAEALAQTAQKDAVRAVANAVIRELAESEQGLPVERRLSDPKHVAERAEDFMDTADAQLARISSGRLSFTQDSMRAVKNGGREIADYFAKGFHQPTPGPNSRPRKS